MTFAESPAFPETHVYHFKAQDKEVGETDNVVPRYMGGMSKREYFAAQIAQGLAHELIKWTDCGHEFKIDYQLHAQTAVQMADALIAALNAEPLDAA